MVEVQWPEALLELDFGLAFDMPVEGVAFPRGLQSLCFGRSFNQDVSRVSWPEGLERVRGRVQQITDGAYFFYSVSR